MSRTAEMVWIGDAASLIREAERADAATDSSTTKMRAATAKWAASATAAGETAAKMAAKVGASYETQAKVAGLAAAKMAEVTGASARSQAVAYSKAADAAKAAAIRTQAANEESSHSFKGVGLAAAAAAGLVVLGAKKAAETTEGLAKETLTLHNATGLSVKSASAYAAVAQVQGLNAKGLNQAFGTLAKNVHAVENAHSGASKAAKAQETALKQLGLPMASITKAHGDLNKLLPEVTERFEKLPGSVNKAAIGMALFGRGWQTLVPLMHSGALGLKDQLEMAEKFGITLSGSTTQKLKEYVKQQEEAKYAGLALETTVGKELAPEITKLTHVLTDATRALSDGVHWLHEHESAAKALEVVLGGAGLTLTVLTVAGKMKALGKIAKEVADSFGGTTNAAKTAAGEMVQAEGNLATKVEASNKEIIASNEKVGKSWGKWIPAIAAAYAAIEAGNHFLPKGYRPENLLGANQPGENTFEGQSKAFLEKYGPDAAGIQIGGAIRAAKQHVLDTGGGIMAFFESKGLSPAQAAGLVGNFQQESSLNFKAPRGGLDQGEGARDHSRLSSKGQLEAIWHELETSERATLAALKAAKTPQEAARIFSERFERPSEPMLSNREKFAKKAFDAHPNSGTSAENLGYFETEAKKAARKSHEASAAQIDKWAEAAVGHFAESWGKNQGPELNKLQAEFHTNAAAWCAEFATTAAMFGGASKAVRTASVASIREWAEAGSHGYQKGITSTPKAGDLMLFGDSHVGFVQSVDKTTGTVTTIEGNTNKGNGAVTRETHKIGDGEYAVPGYKPTQGGGGEGASALKAFEEAAKAKLMLSPAQKASVNALSLEALEARAGAAGFGGLAGSVAETWQRSRGVQESKRKPLGTGQGAHEATLIDKQDILTTQAQKKLYQRAVRELQAEVKVLQKLRKKYLTIASHSHGNAQKEAIEKASKYSGRIGQAQEEAKAYGGHIADSEAAIETAQNVLTNQLPEEIGAADLASYQTAIGKITAEERAGLLTPDQAQTAKTQIASKALAGGYGSLTPEGILQVKGDLREFSGALAESTSAVEAHTEALKESAKALAEFAHIADAIGVVEAGSFAKSLADTVNGQIGGIASGRRVATVGSGSAARY